MTFIQFYHQKLHEAGLITYPNARTLLTSSSNWPIAEPLSPTTEYVRMGCGPSRPQRSVYAEYRVSGKAPDPRHYRVSSKAPDPRHRRQQPQRRLQEPERAVHPPPSKNNGQRPPMIAEFAHYEAARRVDKEIQKLKDQQETYDKNVRVVRGWDFF